MLAAISGVALSLLLIVSAKLSRFDKDISFFPSILIYIASLYVLFAVMAGHSIIREVGFASVFVLLAIYGAYKSLFVVGLGMCFMVFTIFCILLNLRKL